MPATKGNNSSSKRTNTKPKVVKPLGLTAKNLTMLPDCSSKRDPDGGSIDACYNKPQIN